MSKPFVDYCFVCYSCSLVILTFTISLVYLQALINIFDTDLMGSIPSEIGMLTKLSTYQDSPNFLFQMQ